MSANIAQAYPVNMYYYKVFGLVIRSLINFGWPMKLICPSAEVVCEIVQVSEPIDKFELDLIYTSPAINPGTSQPKLQIFSSPGKLFLSYPQYGIFEIQPGKIAYYLYNLLDQQILEALLFRAAFVLWLELIGMPVLHASGVAIKNDLAVGFLANSASGKSTLAAAFIRSGAKFLTDDVFPVEACAPGYRAHPSYAWLRLLPEASNALGYQADQGGDNSEKIIVMLEENFGEFFPDPVPLAALYLPTRRDDIDKVTIEKLTSTQGYLGLLQHSFAGKWLVKSALTIQRMDFLANLVKKVPIRRLVYPSGYEHLSSVVEVVNRDLGL